MPQIDFEEIAPGRYVIHDPRIAPLLKGEGELQGKFFQITSWRAEGLLGRLRMRNFAVLTLADRIAALPSLPEAPPIGKLSWLDVTRATLRFSYFSISALAWRGLEPEPGPRGPAVQAAEGWIIRRRLGRGASSFGLARLQHADELVLQPLDETQALLRGYAQADSYDPQPLRIEQLHDGYRLPYIELPPPHRQLIERITASSFRDELVIARRQWPLVSQVLEALRLQIA